MRAMIRFVVGDAEIYRKMQEEIDDAVNCGGIRFPLSYNDADKLPYFQVRIMFEFLWSNVGLRSARHV